MTVDVTISNPTVAAGATLELNAREVEYNWSGLHNANPVPGKADIVETDVSGWENPVITIRGVIDVDLLKLQSTNPSTSNTLITPAHLYALARVDFDGTTSSVCTLTVRSGGKTLDPSTGTVVAQTNLYASDGTTTTIKCLLKDFDVVLKVDNEEAKIWEYSLTLFETITRD